MKLATHSTITNLYETDDESDYRPEFIAEILKASEEKAVYKYVDSKSFLRQLQEIKIRTHR